jgi:hypothetical protein
MVCASAGRWSILAPCRYDRRGGKAVDESAGGLFAVQKERRRRREIAQSLVESCLLCFTVFADRSVLFFCCKNNPLTGFLKLRKNMRLRQSMLRTAGAAGGPPIIAGARKWRFSTGHSARPCGKALVAAFEVT